MAAADPGTRARISKGTASQRSFKLKVCFFEYIILSPFFPCLLIELPSARGTRWVCFLLRVGFGRATRLLVFQHASQKDRPSTARKFKAGRAGLRGLPGALPPVDLLACWTKSIRLA